MTALLASTTLAQVITAPTAPGDVAPALDGLPATIATVIAAVLVLTGAAWVLVSAIAMHRVRDAISRVNALGPATGMGVPSLVIGAWLHSLTTGPFAWLDLGKVTLTVAAMLLVSSVASNVLARAAILSGAPFDPGTEPNDLLDRDS